MANFPCNVGMTHNHVCFFGTFLNINIFMFVPISNDDVIFTLIYKAIPGKLIRLLCVLIFLDIKFVMFEIIYILVVLSKINYFQFYNNLRKAISYLLYFDVFM